MSWDDIFKLAALLVLLWFVNEVFCSDFDTTTIKTVEIESCYEFGFAVKDTVCCTTYSYRLEYRNWYLKGLQGIDYYSDKPPVVLNKIKKGE